MQHFYNYLFYILHVNHTVNKSLRISYNIILFKISTELVFIVDQFTMRPVQVHEPVYMNLHNFQSLMNSVLIGKNPGTVIFMLRDASKWFSGPNILNFLNQFCLNLPKFDYWGFLSIRLVIFWYNLSENGFRFLQFQKKNFILTLF